jgi:hypothetical protein
MERRVPSLSVGSRVIDGLRRRSGGPETHYMSLLDDDGLATPPKDNGRSHRPTVLLVPRKQALSPGNTAQPLVPHPTRQLGQVDASLSLIPLTPRPDLPSRAPTEASLQSTHTRASQVSRLPTPDFENPSEIRRADTTSTSSTRHDSGYFRSILPRGLSFVSLHVPSSSFLSRASTPTSSRPQSVRSESGESCRSEWSSCTTDSVDSGHNALILSVGTTDKFTHKWPKPRALRGLRVDGNGGRRTGVAAAAAMLEEGHGLGISSVQRWTTFKWCLLFSVCTVFGYGLAGLACAILTWFRGRLFFS